MDSPTVLKASNPQSASGAAESPRLDSRRRFELLEECRDQVLERLSTIVAKALEKMADELTGEALKAIGAERQRALLDAVMLVREQRHALAQSFRRCFGDVFERRLFATPGRAAEATPASLDTADDLTLVTDEAISDKIDVDRLIHRARSRLDPNEVLGIRARLGALLDRDWFDESEHPASPEAIYEALRIAVHELAPNADVRQALLAAFEPHVSGNLNAVYSSINSQLVAQRVLPKIRPRVGRGPGPSSSGARDGQREPGTAGIGGDPRGLDHAAGAGGGSGAAGRAFNVSGSTLAALQQALMRASLGTPEGRGDAVRMLSDPTMFGMADLPLDPVQAPLLESLTEVQREVGGGAGGVAGTGYDGIGHESAGGDAGGRDGTGHDGGGAAGDAGARARVVIELLPLLLEKVKANGTPLDQMTVELVSVVFDYIYADKSLADPVKQQLLRLQVVAVKAALLDRSFFARRQHPMRQLIDRITQLAADPDADLASGSPLVVGLTRVVDQLIAEFATDLAAFLVAIDRIDEISQQETARRSAEIAAQLRAAEREEAFSLALEDGRNEIAMRIGKDTPTFIREFLLRWWTPVIARARVETRFPASEAAGNVTGNAAGNAASNAAGSPAGDPAGSTAGSTAAASADPAERTPEQKALRIAEFLIWSVTPKHPEEVSRLAALLPKLIRALTDGARAVEMPAESRSAFMQELMEAHAKVIEVAKIWQAGQPDPRAAAVRLRADGSVRFARQRDDRDEAQTISVGDTALSMFERGDRIEVVGDNGDTAVYKLAWVSPARKLYILSRYPKETLTFSAGDFTALVARDRVRRVEGTAAVDKAIGEMTREGGFTARTH